MPPAAPRTSKPTNAGVDLGAMPAKLFENVRAIATAGLAKLVDDVNQYAEPIYAPTANGAAELRPERTTPKMTSNSPAVATTSASQSPPAERVLVDHSIAGDENIRF